jgi:hypothetical protein
MDVLTGFSASLHSDEAEQRFIVSTTVFLRM